MNGTSGSNGHEEVKKLCSESLHSKQSSLYGLDPATILVRDLADML
jgi:hypothetical protein